MTYPTPFQWSSDIDSGRYWGFLVLLVASLLPSVVAAEYRSAWPFIANGDRYGDVIAFDTKTQHGTAYVTHDGRLLHQLPAADPSAPPFLIETLEGAAVEAVGQQASKTRVTRFFGADPRRWGPLDTFDSLSLGSPWPGIRASLRLRAGAIERLFELDPGTDADMIRVRLTGADRLDLAPDGSLLLMTSAGELRMSPPVAWQPDGDQIIPVAVHYRLAELAYGFTLGPYDPLLPVIIDPLLQATFVGGTGAEIVTAVAVGSDRVYATGPQGSSDFGPNPNPDPIPVTHGSGGVFIAAYSLDLQQLHSLAFLGGKGDASATALAVSDSAVYLVGRTESTDFPGTASGAQSSSGGDSDGYIARLSLDLGTLDRASYIGGAAFEDAQGLALSSTGVYVTGSTASNDLPQTAGAAQSTLSGPQDVYAALFSTDLATLIRVTYLGGSGGEGTLGRPALSADSLYVTGETLSSDFPQIAGGYQTTNLLGAAFVSRLSLDLTQNLQSTYYGSDYQLETGIHVAVDSDVFVMGRTNGELPGTAGGAQETYGGLGDLFVARFSPTLTSLIQATYVGGSDTEEPGGFWLSNGILTVSGQTASSNLPGTLGAIQPVRVGPSDGFITRLDPSLTGALQSTYLGGTAHNGITDHAVEANLVYAGGDVALDNFPATAGGAKEHYGGGDFDGFLAVLTIDLQLIPIVRISEVTVLEGDVGTTNLELSVAISASPVAPASVTVATADGTAIAGEDYMPVGPLVLTFLPNGPLSQTVTVPVLGDMDPESDERLFLVLSAPNGLEIEVPSGTGIILNDDFAPVPTLPSGALALLASALSLVAGGLHWRTVRR